MVLINLYKKGPKSRKGVPVEVDQNLLEQIKEKVESFANQRDFRVYTKIPASVNKSVLLEDAFKRRIYSCVQRIR